MSCVTLKFQGWPWTGHVFYDTSSFVHNFIAICEVRTGVSVQKSPNLVKSSFELFDLAFWPLTLTFCMDITFVNDNYFWKFLGWVGLWGFLWWAPSAKGKDHHGVSSGWSSVWHRSNTGLSSTQYEQIPIILGIWPFWLTPFFFRSITFWRAYG